MDSKSLTGDLKMIKPISDTRTDMEMQKNRNNKILSGFFDALLFFVCVFVIVRHFRAWLIFTLFFDLV